MNEIDTVLNDFNKRGDLFPEYELDAALRERESEEALAERVAFGVIANRTDRDYGWGTYYAPMAVFQDSETQKWVESPSIKLVTKDMIEYWKDRFDAATQPIMKIRYADVIWDFGKEKSDEEIDVKYPLAVIEETNKVIDKVHTLDYPILFEEKLLRALQLSLALNKKDLLQTTASSLFEFEEKLTQENPKLTGLAFRYLLLDKKVKKELETEFIDKIFKRQLAYLEEVSDNESDNFNFYQTENTVEMLLQHYVNENNSVSTEELLENMLPLLSTKLRKVAQCKLHINYATQLRY